MGIARMRRFLGIAFGAATQVLFLATLPPLYRFLRNDFAAWPGGSLWIDAAAAILFAVPHSILLYPPTRKLITRWLPSPFYGLLFCLVTCVSLWLTFAIWRGSRLVVCEWPDRLKPVVVAGFLVSWLSIFYSLSLTGLGYQTGLTPWWHWMRRRTVPRREFRAVGVYRFCRHPTYLSFLGLIWLTPVVTLDRTLLIAIWTTYIFVGGYLKDERLSLVLGEPYRQYRMAVPAYPFLRPSLLVPRLMRRSWR
jgi:methanethiol S-methyltransferase